MIVRTMFHVKHFVLVYMYIDNCTYTKAVEADAQTAKGWRTPGSSQFSVCSPENKFLGDCLERCIFLRVVVTGR